MTHASDPRPPTRERAERLRSAAGLLEHLADGHVPDDEIPSVEVGVVNLLKRAGVIA